MCMSQEEMDRELASQLIAAREARGLTQSALADRVGMARATINRFEAGHRTPSVMQLLDVCRALGVDAGDLLDAVQAADRSEEG